MNNTIKNMNTSKFNHLILEALLLTSMSSMHFKHGALVIRKGKIVSRGFNTNKDHAEINAIKKLQRVL